MTTEHELRDSLRADAAPTAPDARAWDDVRVRAGAIRRRRRLAQSGIASLAAAAIVAGVVIASGVLDDDKKPSIATSPNAPKILVADRAGVKILSSADGSVVRTVLEAGTTEVYSGVAAAPDGSEVYVSRLSHDESCGPDAVPELVRVDLATGQIGMLVGGASRPILSPDGRWIAYSMQDSCVPGFLGITNLVTGENYRPLDRAGVTLYALEPVAWSPDSTELIFRNNSGDVDSYGFLSWPNEDSEPVEGKLPQRTTAAAYLPDGHRVVAVANDLGYTIQLVDDQGTVLEHLFDESRVTPGMIATRISVDKDGRVLVFDSEGRVLVPVPGQSFPRVVVAGLHDATWLPQAALIPSTTTSTTPTTQGPDVAPGTIFVGRADGSLQIMDRDGAVAHVLRAAGAAGGRYRSLALDVSRQTLYYELDTDTGCDANGDIGRVVITRELNFESLANGSYMALSPDGTKLAYREGSCGTDGQLVVRDLTTRSARSYSITQPNDGGPGAELVGAVAWDADNQHLMLRVNREPAVEFWYVDTATSGELSGPAFFPRGEQGQEQGPTDFAPLGTTGKWMAVYENVGGPSLCEYDLATDACVRPLAELPTRGVRIAGSSANGRFVLLLVPSEGGLQLYRWTEGDTITTFVADGVLAADW